MHDRFSSIQIIRAIAALSVVLFHSHFVVASSPSDQLFRIPFIYEWGYLGVDLFFVVSGFIIAHIGTRDRFALTPFIIRRFFRIYPIYWIFCALAVYLYFQYDYQLGGGNLSIADVAKAFAIFPLEKHPVYAVGWTLEHEILFYVIGGLALWLGGMRMLIIVLSVLSAAAAMRSLLVATHLVQSPWDYHLLSVTNINFLTGIVIYAAKDRLKRLRVAIPLVASFLMFFAWNCLAKRLIPGFSELAQACIVSLASAALITAFLNIERLYEGSRLWRNQLTDLFVMIGNASFSLYLLHWIVFIELGRRRWSERTLSFEFNSFTWVWHYAFPLQAAEYYRFVIIFLTVATSILLYHLIEKPVTSFGHSISRRIEQRRAKVLWTAA